MDLARFRPGYILRPRGKNLRFPYLVRSVLHRAVPYPFLKRRLDEVDAALETRDDQAEILARLEYCNKLTAVTPISCSLRLMDIPRGKNNYTRDLFEYSRFFCPAFFVDTAFGDNTSIPLTPSIVKSRPIAGDNANAVVMNLDKIRHFTFLKDKIPFVEKEDRAIFRGAIYQPHREAFMRRWACSAICDCGDTSKRKDVPASWKSPLLTLYDHLKYKYVLCIEGNDVASNLKWVMSSNSVAVMPRPTYETWFMEGTLLPGVHYIEIRSDFADLEEKLTYYNAHPDEARQIAINANAYVRQFLDPAREDLLSLLVLRKYFKMTGQWSCQ